MRSESDGSTIVTFWVDRPEQAVATILSFGPEADVVLEPAEVRKAVVGEAIQAMSRRYAQSVAGPGLS